MYPILLILLLLFMPMKTYALEGQGMTSQDEFIRQENEKLSRVFEEYAKFYDLPANSDLLEITDKVLKSPYLSKSDKENIVKNGRKIFVFTYPSDGLKIKGAISFVPQPEEHPLLVYLRGGNRNFGLPNPGNDLMNIEQYTAIATLYRGGVSEGTDEFGGADVNDVKNLIEYIPHLEAQLGISVQNTHKYLIGGSRGGLEMFLALKRFPELQTYFRKVVSLSGMVDLQQTLQDRPDLRDMFIQDFGMRPGHEEEWVASRDAMLTIDALNNTLPILIVQGTKDKRVGAVEGERMAAKLKEAGKNVTFMEVEGDHCLCDNPDRMKIILKWLEP